MADTYARYRHICGTAAEWAVSDIVIAEGEIAVELPGAPGAKPRVKAGDGTRLFSQLPYIDGGASITGALILKGSIDPTAAAPATPAVGDLYIANAAGNLHASWGVAGNPAVAAGDMLVRETSTSWVVIPTTADLTQKVSKTEVLSSIGDRDVTVAMGGGLVPKVNDVVTVTKAGTPHASWAGLPGPVHVADQFMFNGTAWVAVDPLKIPDVAIGDERYLRSQFLQAGTGAVARTSLSKLRDTVSVKDFGAVGDGVKDDTAAIAAAAATGKPLHFPYGDYVISSPVTISSYLIGEGADDGQTTITLTSTGQLIVGDWHAHWDGFFIRSAVNNKKFISVPGISYFKCTNFRAEKIGAATGQVAIEFDTTTASVYFNNIDNCKIRVDYPFNITGNSTQAFNANKIGTVATGYYQNFSSAISIGGVLACDANQFAGYFEVGTNAINHTAGALRQNRFNFVLDMVTSAYNTAVTVTDPNIWEILDGGFTTAGTYPQNQILIGPPSTKVRATNSIVNNIINATPTILTFNGEPYDTLSEFANGSGIFTAKNAGYYLVDAAALSESVAWLTGERWEIRIYKNGIEYAKGDWNAADAATTRQRSSRVVTTVYMNGTTDTIDARIVHNHGGPTGTVALDPSPTGNYIDIVRVP